MTWPVPGERETVPPVTRRDGGIDAQLLEIFFDQVPMGIAVFGADLRLQRCNRTWAGFFTHYLGVPAESVTPGKGLFELLPGQEAVTAPLLDAVLAGQVVRQAAHRLSTDGIVTYWDVVFAPTFLDGEVVGFVDIVTDATERVRAYEQLEQRISGFTAIADAMTVQHPLEETLEQVARSVRSATGAAAAAVVVWEDSELLSLSHYADDGLPDGYRAGVEASYALGAKSLIRALTNDTKINVIRGFRTQALADPGYAPLHPMWDGLDYEDTVVVPLGSHGRCVGCLLLYVHAGREVDDDELTFLQAIADQAAVAVENAHLFADAESHATLIERQRLSRELHDSVSQALFAMTLHAGAAERELGSRGTPDDDPLAVEVAALAQLTRGALAEMRALIFELRPDALASEGLIGALRRQAAAVTAREGLPISVVGPTERLPLDPGTEEHLYRLVLEALNNTVKHAGAHAAEVLIAMPEAGGPPVLLVQVTDDGAGFDPLATGPGHLGQATMRDRAAACGAELVVTSTPGAGCTVTVRVPVGDARGARPGTPQRRAPGPTT